MIPQSRFDTLLWSNSDTDLRIAFESLHWCSFFFFLENVFNIARQRENVPTELSWRWVTHSLIPSSSSGLTWDRWSCDLSGDVRGVEACTAQHRSKHSCFNYDIYMYTFKLYLNIYILNTAQSLCKWLMFVLWTLTHGSSLNVILLVTETRLANCATITFSLRCCNRTSTEWWDFIVDARDSSNSVNEGEKRFITCFWTSASLSAMVKAVEDLRCLRREMTEKHKIKRITHTLRTPSMFLNWFKSHNVRGDFGDIYPKTTEGELWINRRSRDS